MKAELPHHAQQRAEVSSSQPLASVRDQAIPDQQKILFELDSIAVSASSLRSLASPLQPVKHVRKKTAVALGLIVRAPSQVHARNGALVQREPCQQFFRDGSLPPRGAQPVTQCLHAVKIFAQDQGSSHVQGIANALRL